MSKTQKNFIPPWMDMPTLCAHICASPGTVNTWVAKGRLPPPLKVEGKQMWEWEEVCKWLKTGGQPSDTLADRIRHGTRQAAHARSSH